MPKHFGVYETDKVNLEPGGNISIKALGRIRESYRIIKNSFKHCDNEVAALTFKGYEMSILEKELTRGDPGKTVLWFNKWSNKHGLSWGRGVGFTLLVSIIALYVFMFTANELEWAWTREARIDTLNALVHLLNITDWTPIMWNRDIHSYNFGYLILFISRIFISYGFYQTVSAFRRFGKN